MGSRTLKQLKSYSFDEIKNLFETTMRRVHTFVPMKSESERVIRELAARSSKRDAEEELEIYTEGARKYWKIIRSGNHTEVYQFFDDMLKAFDREDLVKLSAGSLLSGRPVLIAASITLHWLVPSGRGNWTRPGYKIASSIGEMQENDKKEGKKGSKKARLWINRLSSGSIMTWDLLKNAFLSRYRPLPQIISQTNAIKSFGQECNEPLHLAWERFNDLLYNCLEHKINEHEQLQILYQGLDPKTRQKADYKGPILRMAQAVGIKAINELSKHSFSWYKDEEYNKDDFDKALKHFTDFEHNISILNEEVRMVKHQYKTPNDERDSFLEETLNSFIKEAHWMQKKSENFVWRIKRNYDRKGVGTLPSFTEINPKGLAHAITIRSGLNYQPPEKPREDSNGLQNMTTEHTPTTKKITPKQTQNSTKSTNPPIPFPRRLKKEKEKEQKIYEIPPSDEETCHSSDIIDLSILDNIKENFPPNHVNSIEPILDHLPATHEDCNNPALFAANTNDEEKPTPKLKELPSHLEYAFLDDNRKLPKIEEEDESDTESEDIPEAEKKFKQLARDEEMARKLQEDWETEEERKRISEEEATKTALSDEYDFIQARTEADRLLALKLQDEEREQFTVEERAKFLHG
ncbi:ribonuclease H-like domain-containing protein [Tanacetum coccineum]